MQNYICKAVFLVLFFWVSCLSAQDSLSQKQDTLKVVIKSGPIIFYDGYIGFGSGNSPGFTIGATINYQFFKNNLITARIAGYGSFSTETAFFAPAVAIPGLRREESIFDFGLLYGKRWICGGASFSVSAGLAYMRYEYLDRISEDFYEREETLLGIPFELNLKFFKKQKKRFGLYYGLIPITKQKVAFGRSIGFKLVGNISKANYCAFGISYGFGTHKKY